MITALAACSTGDVTDGTTCGSRTCGFIDHHYDSTFYCPPAPFVPGGWYGYTWHSSAHCHDECEAAASWGCSTGSCDSSCDTDTGSGAWMACTPANGGAESSSGCFLSGSGVNGETVPCVCR
jgi:hypothetical protein